MLPVLPFQLPCPSWRLKRFLRRLSSGLAELLIIAVTALALAALWYLAMFVF